MASASCSSTVYIGLRRARHWAKIRSSGTLSKPEGVRNPLTLDESRRPQDVLRSSQWTSWPGLRWGESLCRSADEPGVLKRTPPLEFRLVTVCICHDSY